MAEPIRLADGSYKIPEVPTTVPTSALSPEQYQQLLKSGWTQSGNTLVAPKVQASDPTTGQFDPRPSASTLTQQGYVKNPDGSYSKPFNVVDYYNDKGSLPLPGDKDTGGAIPGMKPLPPGGLPNNDPPADLPPGGTPSTRDPAFSPMVGAMPPFSGPMGPSMPSGLGPNGYLKEDLSAPPSTGVSPASTSPLSGYGSPAGPALPPGMGANGYDLNSPEYRAWMEAQAKSGGPHPSDPAWRDINGDGKPDGVPPSSVPPSGAMIGPPDINNAAAYSKWMEAYIKNTPVTPPTETKPEAPPPGLTGLPPAGPASTLPGNPGIDMTDANKNGTPDIYEGGPGSPGYTPSKPPAPLVDRDGNGIDDREQTTVGGTGPFGSNYADMWASVLGSTPQLGWNSAIQTGVGAPVDAGGLGGGGGGGYSSPLGGYGTSTDTGGGFQMPNYTPPALPDVSQIGASSGTGTPSTGGTGGGFQFPEFQNPLTTGAGSGTSTTTGGTTPLSGYGSTPTTGGTTPNSGLVQNLAGSYQKQIDAANASNESRYGTGLEMLLKRYEQAGNAMLGLTNEGFADIGRAYDQARARADQDLINRGLANTTVREGINRGYTTDQVQAGNRYWDDQARKNLDEQFRQTGSIVDWIGGRNDVAPSTGDLANLASGVGSAGPSTTTNPSGATQPTTTPAVNLPPQVNAALQNGTLMNYAATNSGSPPSSGSSFLNQGANIRTPEQLSAAVNSGGAVTRSSTPAPPPPSSNPTDSALASYGTASDTRQRTTATPDLAALQKQVATEGASKMQGAINSYISGTAERSAAKQGLFDGTTAQVGPQSSINPNLQKLYGDPDWTPPAGNLVAFTRPGHNGTSGYYNSDLYSGYDPKTNTFTPKASGSGNLDSDPMYTLGKQTNTQGDKPDGAPGSYDPQSSGVRNGQQWMTDTPQASGGAMLGPDGKKVKSSTPDYLPLPPPPGPNVMGFPDPIMGGGNSNNGKTGMDAQYAPGMMGGGGNSFSAAPPPPSMPKPPPPSSPSVMGFPDPQGTGMAPGNPNDVRESMRAQNPNNKQLQSLMDGADSWMKGYGQTDPGYRGGDSGMSQNTPVTPQAMPSAPPSMSNLGVVPQRPEPVPFNTPAPPTSPLSGYGSMPQKPPMVAPPGMPPAPTFQQMGGPGPQYKPPSLVGGVTMPQPPARRWGV